jgi:hypothetical protein
MPITALAIQSLPGQRLSASLYLSAVFEMTSCGSFGAGGVLSQSSASGSHARTASYEGGDMPPYGIGRPEATSGGENLVDQHYFILPFRPNRTWCRR